MDETHSARLRLHQLEGEYGLDNSGLFHLAPSAPMTRPTAYDPSFDLIHSRFPRFRCFPARRIGGPDSARVTV
jgi:hypothetical protein